MKFYGELLVFTLLLITNIRVFFVKHVNKDPIVSLAVFSFFLSLLQILAWGIDFFTIIAFIISFLVLLSNFHAIFRYSENLYIDHYSPLMKFWAIFTTILSSLAIIATIFFFPVELNNNKLMISEKHLNYSGSFNSGFSQNSALSIPSSFITEFSPMKTSENVESAENQKNIILFVPDKRADTNNYKTYLQLLAKSGYTVCSADFYCPENKYLFNFADHKSFRRFFICLTSIINKPYFDSQRELYTFNITQEINAFTEIAKEYYGPEVRFFIVTDEMGVTALEDYTNSNPENLIGSFYLNSIKEYQCPGYGFIEQTDPVLAHSFNIPKDIDCFYTKYIVNQTIKAFNEAVKNSENSI